MIKEAGQEDHACKWKDITEDFLIHKSASRVMRLFSLQQRNSSFLYWTATLSRWKKDYKSERDTRYK